MEKNNQKVKIGNLPSKVLFDHYYEERKAVEYLKNIINSPILIKAPFQVLPFALDALGEKTVVKLLVKQYPKILEKLVFSGDGSLHRHCIPDFLTTGMMASFLRKEATPLLAKRLEQLSSRTENELERRINIISDTFKLSHEEKEVLALCSFLEAGGIIKNYLNSNEILNLSTLSTFRNYGHIVLGIKRGVFLKVFLDRRLFDANILVIRNHGCVEMVISTWCENYLSCSGRVELTHYFFSMENDTALALSELDVPEEELKVLDILMKSRSGHNILLYGEPGTGKTSLAKCLAREYGRQLLTVKIPESNEHSERVSAVYATMSFAGKDRSVILIDEADELLNTHDTMFGSSKTNKSWINNLLETHNHKIFWITNRFGSIHPSTMRRFSFSMEFKNFNEKNRFKVIKSELTRRGVNDYFTEEELRDLCRTYSVNAGGIINAVKILDENNGLDKKDSLNVVKSVLRNHERAVTGKDQADKGRKDFRAYSLEGLNCSEDLKEVVSVLKRYSEVRETEKAYSIGAASLLLYGQPGTGKSEFVYHLGHKLGKEVLLRRASEIQSMWVGQTEKNIADSFRTADKEDAVLFFDEADTFLFPRKEASHSWEKSFTNEILTQLESYRGIVAFATNDMEGLDHASLRRFRFKMEFRFLNPDGIMHFYEKILNPFVKGNFPLTYEESGILKSIKNLAPGDFAVVRDRYDFRCAPSVTHRELIEALKSEVRYKSGEKKAVGF